MPLYTYVMTYGGQTKVLQTRKSNYTGWIGMVVGEAFPQLGKKERVLITDIMRTRPVPVASTSGVWRLSCEGPESEFVLFVVETHG
jgi:hypothetical protein